MMFTGLLSRVKESEPDTDFNLMTVAPSSNPELLNLSAVDI